MNLSISIHLGHDLHRSSLDWMDREELKLVKCIELFLTAGIRSTWNNHPSSACRPALLKFCIDELKLCRGQFQVIGFHNTIKAADIAALI